MHAQEAPEMQTGAQLGGSEGALQQMRPPSVLMAQAPYMLGAKGGTVCWL